MSNEDLSSETQKPDKVYHPDFEAADADVCVQSSDGVLFKLHRNNIITHTTALPLPEGGDPNIATFQEPAKILEILFKFLYPTPPLPDLSNLDFEMLEELGYAAHKYQVASVMAFCDTLLRVSHVSTHPAHMLKYAIIHGWNEETVNTIAKETLDVCAQQALEILGPALYVRWSLYREKWFRPSDEYVWRALKMDVDSGASSIHSLCVKLKAIAVKSSDTVLVSGPAPLYNTYLYTLPRFA